jgi:glycosyltransferase involved in cell wall biosynthesis
MLPWCEHLARLGSQVIVQSNDERALSAIQAAGALGECVNGLTHPIRPATDAAGVMRLARWMQARRFDIVHTHTSKGGFLGRLAAHLSRVPVVLHTVHGFSFHEFSRPWELRFHAALERMASRWCDRLICVSREHAGWALHLGIGGSEKVSAVVNAVPVRDLPSREEVMRTRAGLGLDEKALVIFGAGRLCRQKNYCDLISAMKLVVESHPEARLLLAGEGPLERQLVELARSLGVERSVTLLGFREDARELMAAADVVALSSLWEGMPLAMLEAMAAAKPVVANSIMGVREVIHDGVTGLLVPPRDPERLAEAISGLLADPDRAREIGENARRQVMAEHSMRSFLTGYESIYRELVELKLPAPAASPWHEGGYMVE